MNVKDTRPWNEYWEILRDEFEKQDSVDDYYALTNAFDECAKKIGASYHDIMMAAYVTCNFYHNLYFDEPKSRLHMNKEERDKLQKCKGKFKSV